MPFSGDYHMDAIVRLPIIYQLDCSINYLTYPTFLGPAQDVLIIPVLTVMLLTACIILTWKNKNLFSLYCSVIAILCIIVTYSFTSNFLQVCTDDSAVRKNVWFWVRSLFVLMFCGCVLTVSYIINPIIGPKYCPIWFFPVFIPSMSFVTSRIFLRQLYLLSFTLVFPLLPVYLAIKKDRGLYMAKAKLLFHISATNGGHFEFLAGYIMANVQMKFVREILIWYWIFNQMNSIAPFVTKVFDQSESLNSGDDGSEQQLFQLPRLLVLNCTGSWVLVACTSALLSKVASVFDAVLTFLLENRSDDEDFGNFCALLYMIASLQSHLPYLSSEEQYARFMKNLLIMTVGVLHFSHMSSVYVVESMGATNNRKLSRHLKIYLLVFLELLVAISVIHYALSFPWSTWNVALVLFCSEIIFKVFMLIVIYVLFFTWNFFPFKWHVTQDFDDLLTNIKLFTSCVLFISGCAVFLNGLYILLFDSGGKFRAFLLGLHAYSTIFLQCRDGYRKFQLRRSASKRLGQLEVVLFNQNESDENVSPEVCPICYSDMQEALKTKCGHLFHKNCLRKWIYVQTFCPLCKVEME